MGMSMYQFYFTWWLFYAILITIYSLLWTFMTKGVIASEANFFLYFCLYWLTGLFLLSLGIFIASFFSKAKPGVLCAIIVAFFMLGAQIAMGAISGTTLTEHFWFSLVPIMGLEYAGNQILLVQSFNRSFGFDLFTTKILEYKFSYWFWISIVEIILFYFLGIYLDQVWPKDTGVAKHPLFCFMKSKKKDARLNKVVISSKNISSNFT